QRRRGRDRPPQRGGGSAGAGVTSNTVFRGRAWKFGDNLDTDQIIPAKYAIYSLDEKKLGEHALEGVPDNEGWAQRVSPGDILVAGSNFGCGSSREIAPVAIRGAGISCVIADSYARIFFRNSINLGYPILQSPQATVGIADGDELEVDAARGIVRNLTKAEEYPCEAFPELMHERMQMGGLAPRVRKRRG